MSELKCFHPIAVSGLKRIGHRYDGGYVVHGPSLKEADLLVNYGVGYNVEFEKDFYRITGKPTLAFDPTLKEFSSIWQKLAGGDLIAFLRDLRNRALWVARENILPLFHINFIEEGISSKNSGAFRTLDFHYSRYRLAERRLVLKIDVEGAEYDVFSDPSVFSLLDNCVQILIEFHDLPAHMDQLLDIMERLVPTHSPVHLHHNNHTGTFLYAGRQVPEAVEITFLHNAYLPVKCYSSLSYPVEGLDRPCHKRRSDIPLDFFR